MPNAWQRSVCPLLVLLMNSVSASNYTNTNECINQMGAVGQQCGAFFETNTSLEACCNELDQWITDRCDCNPIVELLLPAASNFFNLESTCRDGGFGEWGPSDPMDPGHLPAQNRTCATVETYHYNCSANDMQVDRDRLANIFNLDTVEAVAAADCLNVTKLYESMSSVFTSDLHLNGAYGGGTYIGLENAAEYQSISFETVNRGMWSQITNPGVTIPVLNDDGSTWVLSSSSTAIFLGGLLNVSMDVDSSFGYRECDTKISTYLVLPTEGLRALVEFLVQVADKSKKYGIEEICRYHETYCAPHDSARQYESEQACIDYLRALPLHSEACGPNRPLSGLSLPCKLKHHFMLPANPALHCPHIGPSGAEDINGDLKCDDVAECSTDIGQDSWPNIRNVGDDMPANLLAIFDQHNVGFEREPLPCVDTPNVIAENAATCRRPCFLLLFEMFSLIVLALKVIR